MPLMVRTWWGDRPRSAMACLSACRTPKSPQPGHQSGSARPLKSLIVSAGLLSSCTIMLVHLRQDLVPRHVARGFSSENRLHTVDNVMWQKRFAVVLTNVAVRLEARLRAQVSRELTAVVVLDNDDPSG